MTIPENLEMNKTLQDANSPEKKEGGGLEIVATPELNHVTQSLGSLHETIDHDRVTTSKDLESLDEAVGELLVDFEGEKIPLKQIGEIPELKKNLEIFQRIINMKLGEYIFEMAELTFLPEKIAKTLFCRRPMTHDGEGTGFRNVKWISNKALQYLSRNGGFLQLGGLSSISVEAAQILVLHNGPLYLDGLVEIPDEVADILSGHKNDLHLGNPKMSEYAKEKMKYQREHAKYNDR